MICIEVGQVGSSLFKQFEDENLSESAPLYPLTQFKQLILDTERKTWRKRQQEDAGIFDTVYFDMGTTGRGNNWSHGFIEDSGLDGILDSFRKMTEASFRYDGCMLMHSLAGGTGSGLGSRLALEIRDAYPKNFIMSCSFSPFSSGETAIQDYNAMLTLASLQASVDFIGLFPNDIILSNTARKLGLDSNCNSLRVSMDNLNSWASQALAGILLPVSQVSVDETVIQESFRGRFAGLNSERTVTVDHTKSFSGWDLITQVTPMPSTKMAMFSSSQGVIDKSRFPLTRDSISERWDDLFTELNRNMCPTIPDQKRSCIGARLNVRDDVVPILKKIYSHVSQMYKQRAYVHWYKKYAKENTEEMFTEAFETVDSILDAYMGLSPQSHSSS
ncbi:hypothetical protein BASA50_003680 [Batrachochytrium salamandrivorans]|uniref:Tubulin/FtsZ GTPase domain-containing protein n=1 Tax=Batrachochytrium salamandrivorans TaxID=1357716 RepID=A0ABQ8FJD1_9FUNG|nr:hypothetical protein BASA50_003680 [Batrachochytrium salamandrivorans]